MYRFNQHSFVGGQLDRGLMGRQDLERYFQGASKLENFIVRKQGNITKRRGTEMIADLGDLFGTGENIAYSRIIPFAYEITGGYYLLLSASQQGKSNCYLISDYGIELEVVSVRTKLAEDGTQTDEIENNVSTRFARTAHFSKEYIETVTSEDGTTSQWSVEETAAPKSIEIPYAGEEFNEIGYNQSGDTLFLVHKNHPPAKIVKTENSIIYSLLQFSGQTWKKPRIEKVTYKKFSGSGASRSVSYVITYVKDGIESEPSEPFVATYKLPWPQEAIIEIHCDKGQNEEEPDYYNVYKKEFSEYGLISSAGSNAKVLITPSISSSKTIPDKGKYDYYYSSEYKAGDYINQEVYPPWKLYDVGQVGNAAKRTKFCGGMVTNSNTLTLSLGAKSGCALTKVWFYPDVFDGAAQRLSGQSIMVWRMYMYFYQAGVSFHAKLTFNKIKAPNTNYTVTSETVNLPHKENTVNGFNEFKLYESNGWNVTKDYNINLDLYRGRLEFDFADAIKKKLGSLDIPFEVSKIEIVCNDSSVIYWHGIECYNTIRNEKIVQDEYITPNLTLTPPRVELKFGQIGDYPSCVSLYTQRLAFASSEREPFTWWMSCVGDLYNFSTHAAIRQDDALEVTVPATEFPNINHMVLSRDLVLFCDNGEWIVRPLSGNTLAYDTVECKKQSAIGCAKSVPPLQVGDEIIFADNSKRVIRSIKYQFSSDGYESNDLSILSQSLFFSNPAVSMCYKQHPESLILCELADGTVAALVYMKEHNVIAWTHHTLGGGWKCRGIASNKAHADETTHVAMLVEKDDGSTEIWRVRDDDESEDLSAQLCMDGLRFALGSEIGAAAFENGQAVIDLENGALIGSFTELEAEKEYAVGYPFTSTFVSVRPEPQGAETFQWELKNAKKVNIRTLNGSSFTVKEAGMGDEYASVVEIERVIENGAVTRPGLVDKFDILLNGENSRDGRIEIKHDGILPLTIESFSIDYETQPLYGSEG